MAIFDETEWTNEMIDYFDKKMKETSQCVKYCMISTAAINKSGNLNNCCDVRKGKFIQDINKWVDDISTLTEYVKNSVKNLDDDEQVDANTVARAVSDCIQISNIFEMFIKCNDYGLEKRK